MSAYAYSVRIEQAVDDGPTLEQIKLNVLADPDLAPDEQMFLLSKIDRYLDTLAGRV